MSLEFINVVVKEEYIVEESFRGSNNLSQDPTKKCGEVFWGKRGNFVFVCALCQQSCSDLLNFGEHIHNFHPLPKDETLEVDIMHDDKGNQPKMEPLDEAQTEVKLFHKDNEEEVVLSKDPVDMADDVYCVESESSQDDFFEKKANPSKQENDPNKTYCCFSCCKIFIVTKTYRTHYRTVHPDMIEKDEPSSSAFIPKVPDKMLCKYCLKTFNEPAAYKAHVEFDHLDRMYSCPHCSTIFKRIELRNYHVNVHEGKKPFKCPHCPQAYTHPSNLKCHVYRHLSIKPYSCRFCEKKFTQHTGLVIHERVHTKEKPYQCDKCGKSYVSQVQLTNHIRKQHNNIKNHKCPHCGKAFFSSSMLKNHIRTHTKETPFSCDICHRKFRARGALRAHLHLHSDVKKYACKLCEKAFAQQAGLYSHMKSHGEAKSSSIIKG